MSHKPFARMTILALLAMLATLIPLQVRAGGVCGGSYTVETGDTVGELAAMCGTTSAAIFSANSGLKEPLTVGQVITIPGANYGVTTTAVVSVTPVSGNATAIPGAVVNNYYTYYYYYYYHGRYHSSDDGKPGSGSVGGNTPRWRELWERWSRRLPTRRQPVKDAR